jgi:cytochrome oxidase assembly protein ShyY1
MVRPRFIVGLLVALAVAAGFAALGQWQLERAIESGTVVERPTETAMPLTKAATPGIATRTASVGQLVTVTGSFVPRDTSVIGGRLNDGKSGYWVVGHFTLAEPGSDGRPVALAVARGWAPDATAVQDAVSTLRDQPATTQTITGRLLPTEAPEAPDPNGNPKALNQMSTAALFNLWHGVGDADVYTGYLVAHGTPPAGLTAIYSPPPVEEATIDWLNVFYAAEWAIFAGFAVFLWYRVVRDAWEREREDADGDSAGVVRADTGEKVD